MKQNSYYLIKFHLILFYSDLSRLIHNLKQTELFYINFELSTAQKFFFYRGWILRIYLDVFHISSTTRPTFNLACCLVILFQSSIYGSPMDDFDFLFIFILEQSYTINTYTNKEISNMVKTRKICQWEADLSRFNLRNKIQSILHPKKNMWSGLVGDLERVSLGSSGRSYERF